MELPLTILEWASAAFGVYFVYRAIRPRSPRWLLYPAIVHALLCGTVWAVDDLYFQRHLHLNDGRGG